MRFFKKKKGKKLSTKEMRQRELDEAQKKVVLRTLESVQEQTRKTDDRIEELRRIARFGNL